MFEGQSSAQQRYIKCPPIGSQTLQEALAQGHARKSLVSAQRSRAMPAWIAPSAQTTMADGDPEGVSGAHRMILSYHRPK